MRASRTSEAGLSLIEILVAVSIMSVLAAAVIFSVQPGDAPLDVESERLSARLLFASDDAIATGQPVGVIIEDFGTGYSFHRYIDGRWWPIEDNPALRAHWLSDDVRLDVREAIFEQDADRDEAPPRVPLFWFDPAGLTDPFTLRLQTSSRSLLLVWDSRNPGIWEEVAG